jgi:hypothetical protein
VERLPDTVPLVLNDLPDPGLEDRARQMLEEERGIVRCMVAELLEWSGQRIGRGRVPGLYPCDKRRRLVVGEGVRPQRAAGVLQLAVDKVRVVSLEHADAALDAAFTPFAERGYHGTAISQVAASWHMRTLRCSDWRSP